MRSIFLQGDIVLVNFDPSIGQEQKGFRPALVLSRKEVNSLSNRIIVAAICQGASFSRDQGLTVSLIGAGTQTQGVVICDQIRAIDSVQRSAKFLEHTPDFIVDEVLSKIVVIFNIELD